MDATELGAARRRAQAAEEKVSQSSSPPETLEALINAAELYMQALRLASDSEDKLQLDAKCRELLTAAERSKASHPIPKGSPKEDVSGSTEVPPPPVSKRKLTTREEIILLEGSKLNGFVFQPWKERPVASEFILKKDDERFTDSKPLQLSPLQLDTFAGWKRPWEALAGKEAKDESPSPPQTQSSDRTDLVQDMTSDCSVVASLCALSSRAEKGHPRIFASVFYPYDHTNLQPEHSPSSKYILRLYFNGCHRKVVVDDLLPTSVDSRIFHVIDRRNPTNLWPPLVEKAYLKVRGGYDFPGSNSGTDLSVLTAWIPEQIFLHDEGLMPEDLWLRIYKAFLLGDVLVTIGTGKLSKRVQKHLGLAAEHDYAILDMKEVDGVKGFLIKNPWSDGDVYKGRDSLRKFTKVQQKLPPPGVTKDDSDASDEVLMAPGTFWMDLGSIFQNFENVYLNWNPGLFAHRQDFHFSWQLSQQHTLNTSFDSNPQYSVDSSQAGPIWLLLSRHFRTGDYQNHDKIPNGFISLYVFKAGGQRVLLSDRAMKRGPFVDSPNTLLQLDASADSSYTVVVAGQELPIAKLNFTISAFSHTPISFSAARESYPSVISQDAAWTRSTAGGNSDAVAYLQNPQFSLTVPSQANIAILLACLQPDSDALVSVHVKVFFTNGSRVVALRTRDVVAHSGDYRRGSAALETLLEKGTYTLVCSTFEAGQLCRFKLSIYTTPQIQAMLRPLPVEGSGRLLINSPVAVFSSGVSRLLAPLTSSRLVRASFIVQQLPGPPRHGSLSPGAMSPIQLTIEQGQGPYKSCLASSARSEEIEYADAASGVRIDDFDMRPTMHGHGTGGLWIVLERISSSSPGLYEEQFQVQIMAESRINIGPWGTGDG